LQALDLLRDAAVRLVAGTKIAIEVSITATDAGAIAASDSTQAAIAVIRYGLVSFDDT
jgi:hypothetical protein